MKKLLIACGILLGSLASAGGIGNLPETVRHFSDGMRNILPDAADVIPTGRGRYTVRNAKQQTIGTLFLEQITDDERQMGYAGTIEIALLFDRDGKVAGVLIGKNQETVSFLNRVRAARFLERWNGLRMEEIPGREIDAVSGATYSSSAIRTGVRKLAESYLADRKDSAHGTDAQDIAVDGRNGREACCSPVERIPEKKPGLPAGPCRQQCGIFRRRAAADKDRISGSDGSGGCRTCRRVQIPLSP